MPPWWWRSGFLIDTLTSISFNQFLWTESICQIFYFIIVIQVLRNLNSAVIENKRGEVMKALQATSLKLNKPVSLADTSLYLKLFKKCLSEKHSDGSELWLEDIHEVTEKVASEAKDVQSGNYLKTSLNAILLKNCVLLKMWLNFNLVLNHLTTILLYVLS